jgi:hypothetical protein
MKSILQEDATKCAICGSRRWLEEHHIFFGNPGRKNSEKFGLKVHLCHYCHNEPPNGVHHNREMDLQLKKMAQRKFEETYSRDYFMLIFGRSYL